MMKNLATVTDRSAKVEEKMTGVAEPIAEKVTPLHLAGVRHETPHPALFLASRPAKAGAHFSASRAEDMWTPAFERMKKYYFIMYGRPLRRQGGRRTAHTTRVVWATRATPSRTANRRPRSGSRLARQPQKRRHRALLRQAQSRRQNRQAALAACIRQLIVILNAILRDRKPWQPA